VLGDTEEARRHSGGRRREASVSPTHLPRPDRAPPSSERAHPEPESTPDGAFVHTGASDTDPDTRLATEQTPAARLSGITLVVHGSRLDGHERDILIAGNRIRAIEAHDPDRELPEGARVLDGRGLAAVPGLLNAHTHTAMVMLRGLADDMPLMPWLTEKIWPFEARISEEDVYWAARLGCIEMIRTGTTFFSDMYWHFHGTARAARDSGMRALICGVMIDMGDERRAAEQREAVLEQLDASRGYGPRIGFALGPHAIYTVSEGSLRWVAETARRLDVPVHTHVAETAQEVADCVALRGVRPVTYLDRLGMLDTRLLAAHCVHLDDAEVALFAERGVRVLHNPVSNLKLASGGPMRYRALRDAGVRVLVGTDGAASNNSLDLYEDLKFAALMAKHATGDPTAMTARQALDMATVEAARAFRLAAGVVEPGALADIALVDLAHPLLFPGHDLEADLVYSAHGRAVVATICDGRVLMEDGRVSDEDEVRAEVRARLARLLDA